MTPDLLLVVSCAVEANWLKFIMAQNLAFDKRIYDSVRGAVVETVPSERLGRILVTDYTDSTDEEALSIDVFLVKSSGGYGGSIYLDVIGAVRKALLDIGEMRFPYVRFLYQTAAT